MANKKIIKGILPICYDALTSYPFTGQDLDALTYYEMLRIIIGKINEMIPIVNLTDDRIREAIRELVDDGTMAQIINEEIWSRYNIFYTPEDFGGVGDGLTDCTDAFDQACHAMHEGDIKILYIPPEKTYLIRGSIAIPPDCMLIGAGHSSKIYYLDNNLPEYSFGTGITTGGDNIVIANLCIDHYQTGTVIPGGGGMTGAVAVSAIEAIGKIVPPSSGYPRVPRKNIILDTLWGDHGRYFLQTDNAADDNLMENIYVRNIIAPGALVSIAPRGGNLKNVTYENIVCDVFRGGAYSGYAGSNININNVRCTYLHARATGLNITNMVIDRSGSVNNDANHLADLYSGNILTNIRMIPGGSTVYNMYLRGSGAFRFNCCEFADVAKIFNIQSAVGPVYLCDCHAEQTGTEANSINGAAVLGEINMPIAEGYTFHKFPA